MANIREILAYNLKENRRKLGITQAGLAEKADVSAQYIAMIEVSRKFPTPEMLERLACALEIETHELFLVIPTPETALERFHNALLADAERVISDAVERAVVKKCSPLNIQQ